MKVRSQLKFIQLIYLFIFSLVQGSEDFAYTTIGPLPFIPIFVRIIFQKLHLRVYTSYLLLFFIFMGNFLLRVVVVILGILSWMTSPLSRSDIFLVNGNRRQSLRRAWLSVLVEKYQHHYPSTVNGSVGKILTAFTCIF